MAKARPKPPTDWAKIASFYAGRPVTLAEDTRGPMSGTTGFAESGEVYLGRGLLDSLAEFDRLWRSGKKEDKKRAAVSTVNALSVLIHEAMHNKNFTGTGLSDAGSERQAAALGAELIPDLMQRFFGVKIGSKLGKEFQRNARSRGEYQAAYAGGFGPVPTIPLAKR